MRQQRRERHAGGLPEANWSEHLVRLNASQQVELSSKFTWPGYYYDSYSSPWLFDIRQAS